MSGCFERSFCFHPLNSTSGAPSWLQVIIGGFGSAEVSGLGFRVNISALGLLVSRQPADEAEPVPAQCLELLLHIIVFKAAAIRNQCSCQTP